MIVSKQLLPRLAVVLPLAVPAAVLTVSLVPLGPRSASAAATATRASALPRLPTQLTGTRALQVRPPVVSVTGDGTAFLGGFTGRRSVRMPSRNRLRWAGHLNWRSWTATGARGRGAVWLNNGLPDDAQGTFFPAPATVTAFRPRHRIFTRFSFRFVYQGKVQVSRLKADYVPPQDFGNGFTAPGLWQWEPVVPALSEYLSLTGQPLITRMRLFDRWEAKGSISCVNPVRRGTSGAVWFRRGLVAPAATGQGT